MTTKQQLIQQAQVFLRKKFEDTEIELGLELALSLEEFSIFTYARRVRHRIYKAKPSDLNNVMKLAIATYRDDDLPADRRYEVAINLVYKNYGETVDAIHSAYAAGILGSIYKRKWRIDSQVKHLFKALEFYQRGFSLWNEAQALQKRLQYAQDAGLPFLEVIPEQHENNLRNNGYSAINVAFICDLLVSQHSGEGNDSDPCQFIPVNLKKMAEEARQSVIDYCIQTETTISDDLKFWFYSTWAEAYMGLKKPDDAIEKLKKARDVHKTESWKADSTRRQLTELISLIYAQKQTDGADDEELRKKAYAAISDSSGEKLIGDPARKFGLALSGGGFRASIFHIGVLAKLAENDQLKDIEVISCVSGGSIIGAYYYLQIKELLESKPDDEIDRQDYLAIVRKIENKFLAGVSSNFRMRIFDNLYQNIIIGIQDEYTRTARLADLYEKELYGPLLRKDDCQEHIYMRDLLITPFDEPMFNIRTGNLTRINKVPMLVLNATSLNTGHCWQFTASWMGEPSGYINNELDARPAYRRMYYSEAPGTFSKVRLATAVAASSCVPGLFSPVTFKGLYKDGTTLQLVDGGLYDNQGINTLNEQECNILIISDASGQMTAKDNPGTSTINVMTRMSDILQERLRDYAFYDLKSRHTAGLVKGYLLMHLTKGLPSDVVEWFPCDDRYEFNDDDADNKQDLTPHQIRKSVQTALSRIRTDLDSFHELESFALMYSGYKMTAYEMSNGRGSFLTQMAQSNSTGWEFEAYEPVHNDPEANQRALKKLRFSKVRFGKILCLSAWLRTVTWITAIVLLVLLATTICRNTAWPFTTIITKNQFSILSISVAVFFITNLVMYKSKSVIGWAFKLVFSVPALIVLWLLFWPMRFVFNRVYLGLGSIDGVLRKKK